jgi:AraC-like DNA-binding protein
MSKGELSVHIRYLMANSLDLLWGMSVNTVGCQTIEKGAAYPPSNHPTRYLFSSKKGRVLEEYQLIYIIQGKGVFISTEQKKVEIEAGNLFILFPNEWHNYRPNKNTGWTEYWIGFKGEIIDNYCRNKFFSKQKPVLNIGIRNEIVQLYKNAIEISQKQKSGFQQMLAGITNQLLGYAYSLDKETQFEEKEVVNQINRAKIIINENYRSRISPKEIASELNMSYSWFRSLFKEYTGFAPVQYILELRIQKSKELLTNTMMPIKEIAYLNGFEGSEYFCTLFKKRAKMTPLDYRIITQGVNLKNK